jgi:hypothetical protein
MTKPVRYQPGGDHPPRQGKWVVLVAFWTVMALLCVVAVVVAVVRAPSTPASACPPPKLCPGPRPAIPISTLHTWTSRSRGVSLQYPGAVFTVQQQDETTLRLRVRVPRPSSVDASVWVSLHPASDGSPEALLRQRQADLAASILGLTEDQDSHTTIPPPRLGDVSGVGGSFRGTADTPQGPTDPVVAILAAASDGRTTAVVAYVITGTNDSSEIQVLRSYLSPILTTFTWARA